MGVNVHNSELRIHPEATRVSPGAGTAHLRAAPFMGLRNLSNKGTLNAEMGTDLHS